MTTKVQTWKLIFNKDILPHLPELLTVSFFINVLALATPIFVLQVYDRVVFHAGITTLQGLVLGMLIVIVFDATLKITRIRFFQLLSAKNDSSLGSQIFDKLFHLPLKTLEGKSLWHWQSLFHDASMVRNVLGGATASVIVDLPFSILFLGVTIIIAPALWWVFILIIIVFIFLAILSERIIHKYSVVERQVHSERDTRLSDLLNRRESVKMMALQEHWKTHWEDKHSESISASVARGKSVDFYRVVSQSLMLIFTVTLTSVGALAILDQQMTIGSLIAANMLGSRLIAPFVQLVEHWRTLIQFRQAIIRVDQFLSDKEDKSITQIDVPEGHGKVHLKNIVFSYNDQQAPAISHIKGSVGPKGLHVLMGRNGSGKSTLLKLLSGFYPTDEGIITLDNYDLRQFTSQQLHKRIAYLPQRPELFQSTIYENIMMGDLNASHEELIDISNKVQLHSMVAALPDGYDTMVTGNNNGLSGGLLQRIALARTLLGKPSIILLDEPTNNLDQDAERMFIQYLKELSTEHTVLVATHSPELLAQANTILVLEAGKVAIAGLAEQVLNHLKTNASSSGSAVDLKKNQEKI